MGYVLGLGGPYHHDASACLVADGQPVAFAEEERFSRIKHHRDSRSAASAAAWCLQQAGLRWGDIDEVAVAEGNQVRCIDRSPAGSSGLDQLVGHRRPGGEQHIGVIDDLRDSFRIILAVVDAERLDRGLRMVDFLGVADLLHRRGRTRMR